MLELKSISKSYESGPGAPKVLDRISLTLQEPAFVCVLGKSGCGKTTLLNIVGGLDHDFEGDLVMYGASSADFTEQAWDRYRASMVGFVFQESHLVDYLTVFDNVLLALSFDGDAPAGEGAAAPGAAGSLVDEAAGAQVMKALERCGIAELAKRKPSELSGGQMQRVAIARALVKQPRIVLADEPTGSLDSGSSREIMDLLAELAQTHLVVVVTHDRDMADEYATRIVELADGKVARDEQRNPMRDAGEGTTAAPVATGAGAGAGKSPGSRKRLSMSRLARKHCRNKKARTFITAAVTSIGLFGMVMMLALNFGAQTYMQQVAAQSLLHSPIQVKQDGSANALLDATAALDTSDVYTPGDVDDGVAVDHLALAMFYAAMETRQSCDLNAFLDYAWNDPESRIADLAFDVQARYGIGLNVYDERGRLIVRDGEVTLMDDIDVAHAFGEQAEEVVMGRLPGKDTLFHELIYNERTGDSPYELINGKMPESYDETVIIANGDGHVTDYFEYAAGIADLSVLADAATSVLIGGDVSVPEQKDAYASSELIGLTYRVVPECDFYYREADGSWTYGRSDREWVRAEVLGDACELKIVGIVKPREGYDDGLEAGSIGYSSELMPYLAERSMNSPIVQEQLANPGIDVFTGKPFDDELSSDAMRAQVARDRKMLSDLMDRGDFSQAKRDYVDNLSAEQVQSLHSMFSGYIRSDGTLAISQSDIDTAASFTDEAFIAAIERYAPASLNAKYVDNLEELGVANIEEPLEVDIYAKSFDDDAALKAEIDKYNEHLDSTETDSAPLAYANAGQEEMAMVSSTINAVSIALAVLVVIALGVSVVMVFSITYVSAIERKSEVGLLRALGASKRDVKSLFNWENAIIGGIAGLLGCVLAFIAQPLVNFMIARVAGEGLAVAAPWWSLPAAVAFGMALAVASGVVPARRAAAADAAAALK